MAADVPGHDQIVCRAWQKPDQGTWEMRDEPRHFTHSKANCWLALHRGIQIAEAKGLPCDRSRWIIERDRVRAFVLEQAAPNGWLQQAAAYAAVPDAATLLVPSLGLLPTTDPLVLETIAVVRRSLERDGLLYRYLTPDGLPGGEARSSCARSGSSTV